MRLTKVVELIAFVPLDEANKMFLLNNSRNTE